MREAINYYYNLNPDKICKIFDYYYFYLDNELYYFVIYNKNINYIKSIYSLNRYMFNLNIIVNEIILNKDKEELTIIEDIPYILMKVFVNINRPIYLSEISYLSNLNVSYQDNLMRSNWVMLWSNKIDYLEYYQEQNLSKHPLLSISFDYFVGMSENAITYLSDTITRLSPDKSDIGVISHDVLKIDDTIYSLYNPLNIIIDHKARDLAEYIKISFFKDNYNVFEELDEYFKYNYFSFYGMNLLIARILYPSFYFELYDEIINNRARESSILDIVSRIDDYEKYLQDVFQYMKKYYNIKDINWLKKR